jgi:hypothetical protein
MLKKVISMLIIALFAQAALLSNPAFADSKSDKEARHTQKVKTGIYKLGAGRASLVEVKLKNRASLAGFVSEVRESSFVVTDTKTGEAAEVAYPDVTKVKGHNLTTGSKIAIIAGAVAVGVLLFIRWATQFE